jgi:hypothetical protein
MPRKLAEKLRNWIIGVLKKNITNLVKPTNQKGSSEFLNSFFIMLYRKHINIHIFLFIVFIILRLIFLLYGVFHIKDFHKSDNYKIHQT